MVQEVRRQARGNLLIHPRGAWNPSPDFSLDSRISLTSFRAENELGINNALALNIMRERDIKEIYSFDKHFDDMPEVKRLAQ